MISILKELHEMTNSHLFKGSRKKYLFHKKIPFADSLNVSTSNASNFCKTSKYHIEENVGKNSV